MVVSKDAKRKRKDSPIVESSPEMPKRTKVQAQRKFAQGQGNPSASFSIAAAASSAVAGSSSQPGTPIRESKEPPPELISHKRPRTEDFLTFLCFRGTKVLPSHLDFLNPKKGESQELKDETQNETAQQSASTSKKELSDDAEKKNDKPEIIPFAVRKRADLVVEGNRKLKNNEKIARLRERIAKKEDTNRRSPRTRSRPEPETDMPEDLIDDQMAEEEKELIEKSEEVEEKQLPPKSKRKLVTKKSIESKKEEEPVPSKILKESPVIKKAEAKVSEKAVTPTLEESKSKKAKARKEQPTPEPVGRMTRQRAFFEPVKVPYRDPEEDKIDDKKEEEPEKVAEQHDDQKAEFSSDDEQPLAKAMKITKKVGKKSPPNKNKRSSPKTIAKEEIPVSAPEIDIKSTLPTVVVSTNKRPLPRTKQNNQQKATENREGSVSHKSDVSSKISQKGTKKSPNKPKTKDKDVLKSEDEASPDHHTEDQTKIKIAAKKSLEPDLSQQSQTDASENETRTGRPMRKTKEAATIYMELIGQKLNLDEFDEDDLSIDSFPELPNAKKTQKMENELKQNIVKPKGKGKGNKKKQKATKNVRKKEQQTKKNDKLETEEKNVKTSIKKDAKDTIEEDSIQLEKSFSDSDDEPLATKLVKPITNHKQVEEILPVKPTKLFPMVTSTPLPRTEKPIALSTNKDIVKPIQQEIPIVKSIPPTKQPNTQIPRTDNIVPKPISPANTFPALERFPIPKVNPTFLTPKYDRNLERRPPVEATPPSSLSTTKNSLPPPPVVKMEISSPKLTSPSSSSPNVKKFEPDMILAANLMPSKEESGKIFGIASVSLAQSSGPDNTKCTLGKCGSIHKPVLGPVVPTEAYLGEQLSSKERRKAKVNMTHEQIQKWLIECSSNPDAIQDDLVYDFDEALKPNTFAPSPSPNCDDKDSGSLVSNKTGKDNVKSESAWSGKGPSLKATPVLVKEEQKPPLAPTIPTDYSIKPETVETTNVIKPKPVSELITKEKPQSPLTVAKKSEPLLKALREQVKSPKPSTSSTATSSPKHQKNSRTPTVTQKKLPLPKRQPVYNTKANDPSKKKIGGTSFAAFSPENETSVYSFDREDDVPPPVAKPFRRHSRRESNTEENSQGEKPIKTEKVPAKDLQQNSVSLTLSPEESSKLVKVSLDGGENSPLKLKSSEKPAQNDISAIGDSDSEGHTFYIPLQGAGATNTTGGKSTDLIQGVAVKLGREGPEGPNQRVIMHATLVTKAQMGSNTTPLPESMNVHEIVKSLLSTTNKECTPTASVGSKSVPVGTVQPRFKSTNDNQNPSSSGLTRVNSNSSLFSGSTKSRNAAVAVKKPKDETPIKMCNNTAFPRHDDPAQMVEAPIFRPTEKEFQDPMEFIERIAPIAARFGICKIIPPDSFKPECRVSDDMRFTAYNQYVHKMLYRWGPSTKELSAIKKYLATQSIAMAHPPWIGGMEVDLPRLYHTVQELGGLKEVIEKKKWARVAEEMCIPKLAQDRVTKLDDIYCKYLLPYDTLSLAERQKLFDEVEADWAKREARARRNADRCVNLESVSNEDGEDSTDDDEDSDEEVDGVSMECIVKGRNMPLNAFFRIARNTMAVWFKNTQPTVSDIEAEFWRHVAVRDSHVCVHSGSIDSSSWGYGFPSPGPKTKASPCAKHPWNLKVLTNNTGSVLRSLGPVMGVTVPTLHVGMLFSACCWYRDPHGLSWIEYLHTGASKIWYGIPDEQSSNFRTALTALIPTHCQNKTIWLPCDTVMVPPHMLTDKGVSLCRTEQKPGEYVVVFPRAYTSSVATGYVVSESVYFATSSWLDSARDDFKDIHDSCEPAIFSLEQLLFAIASDQRVTTEIFSQILPMITEVYEKEVAARQQLKASGVTSTEKLLQNNKSKQKYQVSEEHECDLCRANLYISMVKTVEGNIYCLQHALKNINNGNIQAKQCTLIFTYNIEDIENLMKKLKDRFTQQQKKGSGGGSTSKKK